jgi:hypothetical protein
MMALGVQGVLRPLRALGLMSLIALGGCGDAPTPEQQAALAAQGFYRHLAAGEYEQFLEGRVGTDSLPEAYREQLLTGYRQFIAQQQEKHEGITSVSLSASTSTVTDSLAGYTSVFLLLCYGDSTQEEIVVPMVCLPDGRWRMK